MSRITLAQAAQWCGGTVAPEFEKVSFLGANNDSRKIQPGELFLALEGVRDGHDFIPQAMASGAAAVLCTKPQPGIPAIVVEDTRKALGDIARGERKRLHLIVVGITGSVGKSTTKEMVAAILSRKYRTGKTPVNHNNDIGMPMAILAMPEDTQVAVLEMGMNHFGEMGYLSSIAKPDIAVITNIGTMHIEHLGSREGILKAKMEILEGLQPDGKLVFNGDEPLLWSRRQDCPAEPWYFGMENPQCQVYADDVKIENGHTMFTVHTAKLNFGMDLPVEGTHFVSDALAAIAVGKLLDVHAEEMWSSLREFQNMEGRQEILEVNGFTIIKDCYNAGPESTAASLRVLGRRNGRKIAVLGDMLELGVCAQAEHYRIGRIAASNCDLLFAVGDNAVRVVSGAFTGGMGPNEAKAFETREALVKSLKSRAKPGDTLLFKGSRGMKMEQALELFLEER